MNTPENAGATFFLVDDEGDERILPLVQKLTGEVPGLRIVRRDLFPPGNAPATDMLSSLIQGLVRPSEINNYGLILDLRLDGIPQADGRSFPNYGTSVAQEIRTRETFAGADWCFPIVLLSMETIFKRGYQRDRTGRDLFDLAEKKERLLEEGAAREFATQLVSLAEGYARLRTSTDNDGLDLLGGIPKGAHIGPEIRSELCSVRPRHDLAQFLIRQFLETPGPLVDRSTVLARLGVDLSNSGEDGASLMSLLSEFSYKGIFASGWPRWWSGAIERWWSTTFPRERSLRMLTASERVAQLSERLGLKRLCAAVPIQESYGTRYWIACAATRRPLDPLDAVKIDGSVPAPWQEHRHVHLLAAIKGTELPAGIKIHPSEEERVSRLRLEDEADVKGSGW